MGQKTWNMNVADTKSDPSWQTKSWKGSFESG